MSIDARHAFDRDESHFVGWSINADKYNSSWSSFGNNSNNPRKLQSIDELMANTVYDNAVNSVKKKDNRIELAIKAF